MKEKMITRTLVFTEVEVVAFDTVSMTGTKKVISLVGNFKTDKEVMKFVVSRNKCDTITIVSAHIVGHKTKLFGMTEYDFFSNAIELPQRKVYDYDIVSTN